MDLVEPIRNEGAPLPRTLRQRIEQFLADGRADPRWFIMNVLSRFHAVRRVVRACSRRADPDDLTGGPDLFPTLDVEAALSALERDGVCTGLQLPETVVHRLVEFASTQVMFGDGEYHWGLTLEEKDDAESFLGRTFGFGNFLHLDEDFPLIADIGSDPRLLRLVADYLGTMPVQVISRLWWNFAAPEEALAAGEVRRIAQYFHHDKDDYAALRLFFYLTDVDHTAGPHVVVTGSHRKKSVRQVLSIADRSDQAITAYYGDEAVKTIPGRAGSGFLEDPFCFHKGTAPTTTDRLIVELQFATTRYSVFDEDPERSELSRIFPQQVSSAEAA